MFFCDCERVNKFTDCFESGEYGVLPAKRMLSEEDFKGGFIFVFIGLEIAEGACELVKVIVEDINLIERLGFHVGCIINIFPLFFPAFK